VLVDLEALYFGRDDAELDIAAGGLLLAGFLPTPAYEAVRRARKHLIIGRKGSGKSAICRMLVARSGDGPVTRLVTPDALSAEELRRFELQGVDPGMAKRMLWRYVLATQVAKHLVAHAGAAHRRTPPPVARLHDFLADNGELDRPKFYEVARKLKGSLKLQAFGFGLEAGGSSEGTRTDHQLEVVERHIADAIAALACPPDHPGLLLLVDQIEDVWSEEDESDDLVIGLLKAARAVGTRFPSVACTVFLRSDIYDLLRFADKDKFHGDEARVDWTPERLHELILARARASLGAEPFGPDRLWGGLFPARIQSVPAWEYVVGHTLTRPRDVIHLCNLCRDTAENNGHATITEADVAESVERYSQWKLEDLPNEYLVNYPFLGALLTIFQDRGYVVTRTALARRLPQARDVLTARFPDRAGELTADNVLDVLYDIGFLGVRRGGNVVYAARHGGRVELSDTEFHIHPAFRSALRATRASITQDFEPERVRGLVRGGLVSQRRFDVLARGSAEHRLARLARTEVERLLLRLAEARLPIEVRREVDANLTCMRDTLDDLEHRPSGDVFEKLRQVDEFLVALVRTLVVGGFGETDEGRSFVDAVDGVARQIRRRLFGDVYQQGGGGSGAF
jgi:hypothetical protein